MLSACGGGGGSSDSSAQAGSNAASAGTTGDNALASLVGTYVFPCKGYGYGTAVDSLRTSDQGSIVIKPNPATGKTEVSASLKYYAGSATGDASALDTRRIKPCFGLQLSALFRQQSETGRQFSHPEQAMFNVSSGRRRPFRMNLPCVAVKYERIK